MLLLWPFIPFLDKWHSNRMMNREVKLPSPMKEKVTLYISGFVLASALESPFEVLGGTV